MFRRCLIAALIVSYLAAGLAEAPHAHAEQSADHDARPHLHVDWIAQLFSSVFGSVEIADSHHTRHGHHHHDTSDGHAHSHNAPADKPARKPGDTPPKPALPGEQDHDSTCVYVAHQSHAVAPAGGAHDQARDVALVGLPAAVVANDNPSVQLRLRRAHGPPGSLIAGCELILMLRTLRI